MITAIVTFKLPAGMTREQWQAHNEEVSAKFQNVPGLFRKQFLYGETGIGGGIYLWESREAAEACFYRSAWAENVRRASGGKEPDIVWFETGVVVDNESRQIKVAA